MQTVHDQIKSRAYCSKGKPFTTNKFSDIRRPKAVEIALSRLVKEGFLRKLARGLYDYPRRHPTLGLLAPSPDEIAKAIANSDKSRLQPSGAYAANLLALSEQVPAKIVFLTDGLTRKIVVGTQTIELKRATPRTMAAAGKLSGLVIQAFRHMGKDAITEKTIHALKKRLKPEDRKSLLSDISLAPAWMRPWLRELAEE